MNRPALTRAEFEAWLRREGRARYHDRHPFHRRMHAGALSRRELQRWVENRYYYQTRLPIKDSFIVAKSEDREFRRAWARRLADQDGVPHERASHGPPEPAGLELWLRLAEGVGLERRRVERFEGVLPRVRAACDAYVSFARDAPLVEAVAASLTECFAPDLMAKRAVAWAEHYAWVPREATAYFEQRVVRARADARHGLAFVLEHARTRDEQELCVAALVQKCAILWTMLDAIAAAGAGGVVEVSV